MLSKLSVDAWTDVVYSNERNAIQVLLDHEFKICEDKDFDECEAWRIFQKMVWLMHELQKLIMVIS